MQLPFFKRNSYYAFICTFRDDIETWGALLKHKQRTRDFKS